MIRRKQRSAKVIYSRIKKYELELPSLPVKETARDDTATINAINHNLLCTLIQPVSLPAITYLLAAPSSRRR